MAILIPQGKNVTVSGTGSGGDDTLEYFGAGETWSVLSFFNFDPEEFDNWAELTIVAKSHWSPSYHRQFNLEGRVNNSGECRIQVRFSVDTKITTSEGIVGNRWYLAAISNDHSATSGSQLKMWVLEMDGDAWTDGADDQIDGIADEDAEDDTATGHTQVRFGEANGNTDPMQGMLAFSSYFDEIAFTSQDVRNYLASPWRVLAQHYDSCKYFFPLGVRNPSGLKEVDYGPDGLNSDFGSTITVADDPPVGSRSRPVYVTTSDAPSGTSGDTEIPSVTVESLDATAENTAEADSTSTPTITVEALDANAATVLYPVEIPEVSAEALDATAANTAESEDTALPSVSVTALDATAALTVGSALTPEGAVEALDAEAASTAEASDANLPTIAVEALDAAAVPGLHALTQTGVVSISALDASASVEAETGIVAAALASVSISGLEATALNTDEFDIEESNEVFIPKTSTSIVRVPATQTSIVSVPKTNTEEVLL